MHIQRLRMNFFNKIFRAISNSNVLYFSLIHFWSKFQWNLLKFYPHNKNGQKKIYLQENDAKMTRFIIEDTQPTARKCLVVKLVLILNLSLKLIDIDFIAYPLRMIMKYFFIDQNLLEFSSFVRLHSSFSSLMYSKLQK